MKKSRKKPAAVNYQRVREVVNAALSAGMTTGQAIKEVAAKMKSSESSVYRALGKTKSSERTKPLVPALLISVRLPQTGEPAVIQVRTDKADLVGTLTIESAGIRYRRPNAKGLPDRLVSWETLDKLTQLGLS